MGRNRKDHVSSRQEQRKSTASALEQMKAAREQKTKRLDQIEIKEEALYDVMDEDNYNSLLKDRRSKGAFVVDDQDGDYEDDGEELFHQYGELEGGDSEKNKKYPQKRRKKSAGVGKSKKNKPSSDGPSALIMQLQEAGGKSSLRSVYSSYSQLDSISSASSSAAANPISGINEDIDFNEELKDLENNPLDDMGQFGIKPQFILQNQNHSHSHNHDHNHNYNRNQSLYQKQNLYQNQNQNEINNLGINDYEKVEEKIKVKEEKIMEDEKEKVKEEDDEKVKEEEKEIVVKKEEEESVGIGFDNENSVGVGIVTKSIPSSSKLQLDSSGNLRFFFLDAVEDTRSSPGTVYMFGKVLLEKNIFASCCVIVQNIQRSLFFVPSPTENDCDDDDDKLKNLGLELESLRKKLGIKTFLRKIVKRKYAFNLPESIVRQGQSKFVKVKYPYTGPVFSESNGNYFSHVFGVRTSALEHLLIKRKIKGPIWLHLKNVQMATVPKSTCDFEIVVKDKSNVAVLADIYPNEQNLQTPPLRVVSLNVKTIQNLVTKKSEIVIASFRVMMTNSTGTPHNMLGSFTVVRKLPTGPLPYDLQKLLHAQQLNVQVCHSERDLLVSLISKLGDADPDILVGHNILGYDLDVLLSRITELKIHFRLWTRLGRLGRTEIPGSHHYNKSVANASEMGSRVKGLQALRRKVFDGRLICDTYKMAKELVRAKNYSLATLADLQLGLKKENLDLDNMVEYFKDGKKLVKLLKVSFDDTYLTMALVARMNMLPLTLELTRLSGNLWNRSLQGARAERIEYCLLHRFHQAKYIVPDKVMPTRTNFKRKKADYAGGLVLEPKRGFYDRIVLLLDFKSLYPSVVQEYNICFTTVERKYQDDGTSWDAIPPDSKVSQGILPNVIRYLVTSRGAVKAEMKNAKLPHELDKLNTKQLALKLIANSMYGCLGFTMSRFYARPLANLITEKGREALVMARDLATGLGHDVIYGDTDSIMVHTGLEDVKEARKIAGEILREVNKEHRSLEIEIDGIFKAILLLKKKKYAALVVQDVSPDGKILKVSKELKGLDLVRRDWCDLSKELGQFVLDEIMSGKSQDDVVDSIHSKLRDTVSDMKNDIIPIEKYVITKGLTMDPHKYNDPKSQPHVTVALRMLEKATNSVNVGDHIGYVICTKGNSDLLSSRAFSKDEVERMKLDVDISWYLSQQIHPPVSRLCEPIPGINAGQIAECLGLDSSKYNRSQASGRDSKGSSVFSPEDRFFALRSTMDDDERFRKCTPFSCLCTNLKCQKNVQLPFPSLFHKNVDAKKESNVFGVICPFCKETFNFGSLINQMNIFVRKAIAHYYAGTMVCEEPSCKHASRSLFFKHHLPRPLNETPLCSVPGCDGTMRLCFTDTDMYDELCYLCRLFDLEAGLRFSFPDEKQRLLTQRTIPTEIIRIYEGLLEVAEQNAELNCHKFVDLGELFNIFQPNPKPFSSK